MLGIFLGAWEKSNIGKDLKFYLLVYASALRAGATSKTIAFAHLQNQKRSCF